MNKKDRHPSCKLLEFWQTVVDSADRCGSIDIEDSGRKMWII
jgi:hypothetical protein